jgi:hypothetical protein
MTRLEAGSGSIKGTLTYCNNMPELGWTLGTSEKEFTDVPVWLTNEGMVVGSVSGKFFNITKNKLRIAIPSQGASLYRNRNGIIQILTSFKAGVTSESINSEDADTYDAFLQGLIDSHNSYLRSGSCRAGFQDDVTCTVLRDGLPV